MTATSLVPDMAAHRGMSFPDLVRWMVEDASCER
jgi:D-alanine-D-alanine ligase